MRTEKHHCTDERIIESLMPENETDIEELERLQLEGKVDGTEYMHGEPKEKFEYEMRKRYDRMKCRQENAWKK